MKTDLVKLALDSGCAYLPPGDAKEPLYIFSLKELIRFATFIRAEENEELVDLYTMALNQAKTIRAYQERHGELPDAG